MTADLPRPTAPDRIPGLTEIFSPVSRRLELADRVLRTWSKQTSPQLRRMASRAIPGRGKMIRPGILLLITGHLGYRRGKDIVLAAVVEALHLASLIHDDIIDRSPYRRGEKTALQKFGPDLSLLLGDFFFIRSIARSMSVEENGISELLTAAAQSMIEGEIEELTQSYNYKLRRDHYLRIIGKKTASLFRTASQIACRLGRAEPKEAKTLEEYGHNLGLAFQVIDDLLDLVGQPSQTGKPAFSDLKEGRVTLPLIYALRRADPATREKLQEQLEKIKENKEEKARPELFKLIQSTGAFDLTFRQASALTARARAAAERLRPSVYRQSLIALADFVLWRKK